MNTGARALRTGGHAAVEVDSAATRDFGWSKLILGRYGAFLANPRDVYLGRAMVEYGEYSEGEVDVFKRILSPDGVVVEVGANAGYLTVPIARLVGPKGLVLALEPQRVAFEMLCANAVLNGLMNIRPYMYAASREPGAIDVPILDPMRENNFGGIPLDAGQEWTKKVPAKSIETVIATTIDAFGLGQLDLLKADVEGMEIEVLDGARGTIQRCRPAIYVEADREEKTKPILSFLDSLGYAAYWHFPRLFNPANFFGKSEAANLYGNTVSINLLAVPEEKRTIAEAILKNSRVASVDDTWPVAAKRILGA